jgi:hypothetical protein
MIAVPYLISWARCGRMHNPTATGVYHNRTDSTSISYDALDVLNVVYSAPYNIPKTRIAIHQV